MCVTSRPAMGNWERSSGFGARDWPWNELTVKYATDDGRYGVLEWALSHGCSWTANSKRKALNDGFPASIVWPEENMVLEPPKAAGFWDYFI